MPTINTNEPINVLEYVQALRKCVRELTGVCVKNGRIDEYEEVLYNEETQTHIINISFNEGDDRTLKIKFDINPDPE